MSSIADDTMENEVATVPRAHRLCGFKILPYSHPRVQVTIMGCILALTVGMYCVVTNLGGAGQKTAYLSDVSNMTLYAVFAAFLLVAPACLAFFSLRTSLVLGGTGYAAYVASLWSYNRNRNVGFVIFGGAWNGLSAAFLWPAITTAVTSYATESQKGFYVTIYWTLFNFGVVVASIIPLVLNWDAGVDNGSRVSDGTYIVFLVLTLLGCALGLTLYPWNRITREDGTRVSFGQYPTFKGALKATGRVFMENKWIIWVWPFFWSNYYWFIYQNNSFNGIAFTVRARSLNIFANALGQIFAAWILTPLMDKLPFQRRTRAIIGVIYILVIVNAVCAGGYFAMRKTERGLDEADRMDIYDHNYGWWCLLFTLYGLWGASCNVYAHWFIGALSNDPTELSVYNSMFNFFSAASQMVGYIMSLKHASIEVLFYTSWAYVCFGLLCLLPVIKWYMKESNIQAESEPAISPKSATSTTTTQSSTGLPIEPAEKEPTSVQMSEKTSTA